MLELSSLLQLAIEICNVNPMELQELLLLLLGVLDTSLLTIELYSVLDFLFLLFHSFGYFTRAAAN